MNITEETLEKMARLARLEMAADEKASIRNGMEQILGWMAKLGELPLDDVEPLIHMSAEVNAFRTDEPGPAMNADAALQNAPESRDGFFRVPRVIDLG